MALIESWVKCELSRAVQVQYLQGNLFSADNQGNLVGVRVFENGEPASISGSVSANVIRADGTTVPVAGTLTNGNECYVILPQAAYAVTGVVTIVIKITASSVVTTLAAIVSTVYASTTDAIVDPGTIIPSIETLIAAIEAAVATIPADYSSLWATIAPAYTSLTFPVSKGQYCTNNGHMYRAKQDIATSETFTSSHWEVCNVGVELFNQIGAGNQAISDLKSALDSTNNDLFNYEDTGNLLLTRGKFERDTYNPNTGEEGTTRPYRIASRTSISFPFDVALIASSGYKFLVYLYSSSSWVQGSWVTTSQAIPANTPFYIQITKNPEGSTPADIIELINAINIDATGKKLLLLDTEKLVVSKFQNENVQLLNMGEWKNRAYIPSTGVVDDKVNRISTRKPISFPFYATLQIKSGFRVVLYLAPDYSASAWRTGMVSIEENTPFYMLIARETEITETADISEFLSAITVDGSAFDIWEKDYTNNVRDSIIYKYNTFELGKWTALTNPGSLVKRSESKKIRSIGKIKVSQSILVDIKVSGVTVTQYFSDSSGIYQGNISDNTVGIHRRIPSSLYDTVAIVATCDDFSTMPADLDQYFTVTFENDAKVRNGKQTLIYKFGGAGNEWCFVRTPDNYNQFRQKPYPFVICNHGNGWVMDGTIGFANWTNRTMYVPENASDFYDYNSQTETSAKYNTIHSMASSEYNVTADQTLWYSNPTIEALLTAGYVVCGCENYGDKLFGNNNCRNACVDFFYHMVKTYNVEDRCYMIGASNGAMTSLNAAYLLQGKVKAMVLQYPLTCLFNQYKHPGSNASGHPAEIRSAYGISSGATDEQVIKAIATHDPLTTDVVDGKKVGVFPSTKLYYSPSDTVVDADQNALALAEMLNNSNKVVATVECSGEHGDHSMFNPSEFVTWFNAN